MEEYLTVYLKVLYDYLKEYDPITVENLEANIFIAQIIGCNFEEIMGSLDLNEPFSNLTPMDYEGRKQLIYEFFKAHNIEYQIDDSMIVNEQRDINEIAKVRDGVSLGLTTIINGKPMALVPDYGIMLDSTVLLHEVSHLRNLFGDDRPPVNSFLTEAIAFSEELIFADYLEEIGYLEEAIKYKNESMRNFYFIMLNNYDVLKIFALFQGDNFITPERYYELYEELEEEVYKNEIMRAVEFTQKMSSTTKNFLQALWYNIACAISIYIYEEYKKDKNFITHLERLHTLSNTGTLEECLNEIGLTNLMDSETLRKIDDSLIQYLNEIKEKVLKENQKSSMHI